MNLEQPLAPIFDAFSDAVTSNCPKNHTLVVEINQKKMRGPNNM